MARRRKTKTRSKEIVVRPRVTVASPAVRGVRALSKRARPYARAGLTKAKKAALAEKHTLAAVASAGVLGYAEAHGMLEKIPTFGGLDKKIILALAAWGVGKYTKNNTMQHVSTGLLSVAVYDAVKSQSLSGYGYPVAPLATAGYGADYDDDDEF